MLDHSDPGPVPDRDSESEVDSSLEQLIAFIADADADDNWPRPVPAPDEVSSGTTWQLDRVLVSDVMTRDVVTVPEGTTYSELLAVLAQKRLGAVPVVDDQGRVVGIVSESDLLAKMALVHEIGSPRPSRHQTGAEAQRKSRAEDASGLMTTPAVTVMAGDSVLTAARLVTKRRLRRLPVVDGRGRLLGIVSRSDLLRLFRRDDLEIRDHVIKTVLHEEFCLPPGTVVVNVAEGVVSLRGQLERAMVIPTLIAAVSGISGVVAVRDHLTATHHDAVIDSQEPS